MTEKSEISGQYLHELNAIHGGKPYPKDLNIVITGAMKKGSIGEAIDALLNCTILFQDVRDGDWEFRKDDNVLIMCHGVTHLDWFEDASLEQVKEIFDVNLYGSYNVAQAFVKHTIDSPYRKRIISIGSMAYRKVLNASAAYCASKAGLAHLMSCLAWELAPKGYDVYCIHPSNTEGTPMTEDTIQGLMKYRGISREAAEAYWSDSPIRNKILQPLDIAKLIYDILYSQHGYLSGAQLDLAGGQR